MGLVGIDVEQHFFCFEMLANELRLDILRLLDNHGMMNVTQIAAETKAERSRVSHSLAILKQCSLVNVEKQGREMRYSLNPQCSFFKKRKGNFFDLLEEHIRTSCPKCEKYRARRGKRT